MGTCRRAERNSHFSFRDDHDREDQDDDVELNKKSCHGSRWGIGKKGVIRNSFAQDPFVEAGGPRL